MERVSDKVYVMRPMFGRDYSNEEQALQAWNDNKDWVCMNMDQDFGRATCKSEAPKGTYRLRFSNLQNFIHVEV